MRPANIGEDIMALVDQGPRTAGDARDGGAEAVTLDWLDGDTSEAAGRFAEANVEGEVPVTGRDREALVGWVLASQPMWSDRRIAWGCGVSPRTVARHRQRVEADGPATDRRIGLDGRVRPARAGVLRERVAAALEQDPGASLRAIASRVGASPETVRRVRRAQGLPEARQGGPSRPGPSVEGASRPHPPHTRVAREWADDPALRATDPGVALAQWLVATDVGVACWERAADVPLGRVYEIADEARRRAACWLEMAEHLEARALPAGSGRRRP